MSTQQDTPSVSLSTLKCPSCAEHLTVGLGQHSPQILYVVKPQDMVDKKNEFLKLVDDSTMSDEQKANIKKMYGAEDVMLDMSAMQVMIDEVKKNYTETNPIITE